jgi:flavin-dependent dehydrogenase
MGAGPAGCACAMTLARAECDVVLVHRPALQPQVGDALPPFANRLLRELGVMEAFLADGPIACYGNLSAWGGDDLESTDFIRDPDGHGWHVDRNGFDRMLREAAVEAGVRLSRADELPNARWVVDCTGRSSVVAKSRGVRRISYGRLTALVSCVEACEADRELLTCVEAVEGDWWYTALTPSRHRVLMYFTERPVAGTAGDLEALVKATKHVSKRLLGRRITSPPIAMSASTSRLERFAGDDWVAAGDAAAAHDPISSMGICAALRGGMLAAEALKRSLSGDADAIPAYCAAMEGAFSRYLRDCVDVYAMLKRAPRSVA